MVRNEKLRRARRWLGNKYLEVRAGAIARREEPGPGEQGNPRGVRPENVVWIFGSGRSGSTWLRSMMSEIKGHEVWEEPLIGRLFGEFYEKTLDPQRRRPDFVMADATRKGWLRSIRNFVLDGARYARPGIGPDDYLVVKEPNGSAGAPLLTEALPESRMILLIRDPRDVISSVVDGARRGSWLYEWREKGLRNEDALAETRPKLFVGRRSRLYRRHVTAAHRAYEAHKGPKVLVRYEELRADTPGTLRRIYDELGLPADPKELARAVEKHSWERIPEKDKGEGKFYRKGVSGGWRQDLTPEQVAIVERITASLMQEFYPDSFAESSEDTAGNPAEPDSSP